MDFHKTLERIYEHLEEDRVENAVMGCLRVARANKDHLNSAIFLRELYPSKAEVVRVLIDELAPLKPEARQFILTTSAERWLALHTLETYTSPEDMKKPEGDRRNVFTVSVGEIQSELDQWEKSIGDNFTRKYGRT